MLIGGEKKKKASPNPAPNPQQALKHMHSGGPAAALSLSCSSRYFSLSYSSGSGEELVRGGEAEKGTSHVCPAAVRSAPWRADSPCQRTLAAIASTPCVRWEAFLALLRLTGCCVVEENVFPVTLSLVVSPPHPPPVKKAER